MNQQLHEQLLNAALMVIYRENNNQKIAECQDKIKQEQKKLFDIEAKTYTNPPSYSSIKGWGIFFVIAGAICAIADTIMIFMMFTTSINETPFDFLICIAFYLPLYIGILLLVSARKVRKKYNSNAEEEYDKTKAEITDPAIAKINEDIAKINEDTNKFWNEHKALIDFLPIKYQTLDAVLFMLECVKNLRAESLKEAINLYEEEIRARATQKAIAQQTMLQQLQSQRLNDMLSDIEQNQQRIHSDLQTVQAMQFYDIINK